ncbi:M23 family metallopeptidase [Jeotgalibacillus campisalis]|uniref:Peptidase M23 n=1 Tax=Jeotgalibacillus campisalis TaxID=220754 RepID=A0A0C2RLQ4_9BACL|nr:M23 family metallopeptidase [Jeotgalibacillus campisalis]KIL51185.1 peptidase M23 [Jeotgalibacillus campisalis]
MKRISLCSIAVFVLLASSLSAETKTSREDLLSERMGYYIQYGTEHFIPWYYIAAVDQFERNIQLVRDDIPKRDSSIAIQFHEDYWAGSMNPNKDDTSPATIDLFGGKGLDGNNDEKADRNDVEDVLYTMAAYLSEFGNAEENFKIALWEYYRREETVRQIMTISKIYQQNNTLDLYDHVFPLPKEHNYSYRTTWGDNRGWGGKRIHEGTDLFANYGVPVRATTHGVIEVMGWNEYGGWRVGLRDIHNIYHYFAHLGSFNKELKKGDVVKTGTIIGYVGSSGYGKEGTSGKFPPHLHYGMYLDNGRTEWAFDPYPSLRIWENRQQ